MGKTRRARDQRNLGVVPWKKPLNASHSRGEAVVMSMRLIIDPGLASVWNSTSSVEREKGNHWGFLSLRKQLRQLFSGRRQASSSKKLGNDRTRLWFMGPGDGYG